MSLCSPDTECLVNEHKIPKQLLPWTAIMDSGAPLKNLVTWQLPQALNRISNGESYGKELTAAGSANGGK